MDAAHKHADTACFNALPQGLPKNRKLKRLFLNVKLDVCQLATVYGTTPHQTSDKERTENKKRVALESRNPPSPTSPAQPSPGPKAKCVGDRLGDRIKERGCWVRERGRVCEVVTCFISLVVVMVVLIFRVLFLFT